MLLICTRARVSNMQPVGRMWPTRAFCVAHDAFQNFQLINICIIYFIHCHLKVLDQRMNKFLLNKCSDGQK